MTTVNLVTRFDPVSAADEDDSRLFSSSARDFSDELHEIWATIFLQNIRGRDFVRAFGGSAEKDSELPAEKNIVPLKQSDGAYFVLFLYVAFIGVSLGHFIEDAPKLKSILGRSYRLLLTRNRLYHFRSSYLRQLDFFNLTVTSNSLWSEQHHIEPSFFRSVKTSFYVFCMDEPFEKTIQAHTLLSKIELSELKQIISSEVGSLPDSRYLIDNHNVFVLFEQIKSYQRGIARLRKMLTDTTKGAYELNSMYRLLVDECNKFLKSHLDVALALPKKDFFEEQISAELSSAHDSE